MLIAKKLRDLMESNGDTKVGLGAQTRLSDQTINNILNGSDMKVSSLQKIALYYKMPIGYFFDETNRTYISGDKNQIGNGNVIIDDCPAQLNEAHKEIEHLKQIIEEKERLIQVLLNK